MSQAGIIDVEGSHPQIPTMFVANVGTAIPIANTLEILGEAVTAHGIPLQTVATGNTISINAQYASAAASSDAANAGVASFNSADFSVDSNGFVTFTGGGGSGIQTIEGNSGGPVPPDPGTFNLHLIGSAVSGIDIVGNPLTFTLDVSNLRDVGRYVVSPTIGQAGYTSIQTAINQAVTDGANATRPATIWIFSGTYTEDLTLAPFVSLACKAESTVTIIGNATFTPGVDGETISLEKITFTTPIGGISALTILGTNSSLMLINNCTINGDSGDCISINNTNSGFGLFNSIFNASTGFKIFDIVDCSNIRAIGCNFTTTDTASTIGGNSNIIFIGCYIQDFFTLLGNAFVSYKSGTLVALANQSALTIGPTNNCIVFDMTIACNAPSNFWATGTGNLIYSAVTPLFFFPASQIDPNLTIPNQSLMNRNLTFDGVTSIVNDGELIIGSSTSVPQIATLTAGTGIAITNAPGSITIATSAGIASTYTSNSGTASPAAGNLNVFGSNTALNGYSPWTTATGDTVTVNMPGTVKFVVNPTPGLGTHTTIAAAIAAASAQDIIFITGGTYTEDLTIDKNLTFTCFAGSERYVNVDVVIRGKTTINGGVSASYININCQTNGDSLLVHNGNGAVFTFDQCDLSVEGGVTGIIQDTGDNTNNTFLTSCFAFIQPTGQLFDLISGGVIWADWTDIEGDSTTLVPSTVSGGSFTARFCAIQTPLHSPTTGGQIVVQYCQFGTVNSPGLPVVWINQEATDPSINSFAYFCRFSSEASSCINVGASAVIQLYNCNFNSSNTNVIIGAGTTLYSNLSFINSTSIASTTQIGGVSSGGVFQNPSPGFIGEQITTNASNVNVPNATATNVTSINLTEGVWDITGMADFSSAGAVVGTSFRLGIGDTSATMPGAGGINQLSTPTAPSAASNSGLTVCPQRVVLTTPTTYYLVCLANFTVGTVTISGIITATRVG